MKDVLIVFFVLFFVLMILVFPFKTRLMGHFDLIEMKGFYSFKVWRLKLLCGMIFRDEDGVFKISNADDILKGNYNKPFVKEIAKQILTKINVKKIELFFTGGAENDSYTSAIICGSMLSIVQSLYSYLSLRYDDVKLYEDISPTYNDSNFELTFDFVVSVSILGLALALVKSSINLKKKGEVKNEG